MEPAVHLVQPFAAPPAPPYFRGPMPLAVTPITRYKLRKVVKYGLVTTAVAWRSGNERRDVNLLAVLTALWGAGTAAALGW